MPGAVGINTGTLVGISATLPATFDSPGYTAVTFTSVGEVIDAGAVGKVYSAVNHQALARRYPMKFKDVYDVPNVSINIARDWDDAGQVIVMAAVESDASYSFKFTFPDGEIGYFTGKVLSAPLGAAAVGSVRTIAVDVAVDPQSLFKVAA